VNKVEETNDFLPPVMPQQQVSRRISRESIVTSFTARNLVQ